jgi:hypothetical protein
MTLAFGANATMVFAGVKRISLGAAGLAYGPLLKISYMILTTVSVSPLAFCATD